MLIPPVQHSARSPDALHRRPGSLVWVKGAGHGRIAGVSRDNPVRYDVRLNHDGAVLRNKTEADFLWKPRLVVG